MRCERMEWPQSRLNVLCPAERNAPECRNKTIDSTVTGWQAGTSAIENFPCLFNHFRVTAHALRGTGTLPALAASTQPYAARPHSNYAQGAIHMQNETRRSFVRSALAGAAFAAVGPSLARPALAADDMKEVKFAEDPTNLKPGQETSHTPSIALEKVDSKAVAYGKTPPGEFYRVTVQARHEATNEHYIGAIALYLNGKLVAEHTMNKALADASLPAVTFVQRLKAGDKLLAVTDCNVHGKWGNRTTV